MWALCKVSSLALARVSCWLRTLAALLEVRECREGISILLDTQLLLSIWTSLFLTFNASTSVLISSRYSQSLFCHSHQQMLSRSKGTNLGRQFPGRIVHTLDLYQGQVVLAGMSGRAQCLTGLHALGKNMLYPRLSLCDYFYSGSANLKGKAG